MRENDESPKGEPRPDTADWKRIVAKYQEPSRARAAWQIVNTLGPFALLWYLMYHTLAVSWRLTDGQPFNLYDLGDRLRSRGWLVAAYPLPADRQDEVIQRVLVRHGFSHDMSDLFLLDLRRSVEHLLRHQPSTSLTRAEAGSFDHNAHRP